MNILIEGWRGINHSYSLVNQWQILELLKSNELYFKDIPFISKKWNPNINASGLLSETENIINKIPSPSKNQQHDITYRISCPFDFDNYFNSKLLFVFGTCEYKFLEKANYKNDIPERLKDMENFFIHAPSNWSKEGFINSGFDKKQIIVVGHGIDEQTFNILPGKEKKKVRRDFKINSEDFVLTNIGAMTKNKGVELLVAAYGILKKTKKNLKLILKDQSNLYDIGTNHLFEEILNSELNKRYKIINDEMMKDIIIISENLSLLKMKELYTITDCYVSPYLAEGFNLTPLEAASCGTQILVTKGGSTDDYFDNCMGYQIDSSEKKINNSYLLEPKLDSLVSILKEKIIDKSDNLRELRANFVHKNYSWTKIANKLNKEFKDKLR